MTRGLDPGPSNAGPLHAGLVALRIGGAWRGALIRGASGAGKSDLALRALAAGFQLVADDRVLVWTSGGRLFGRAPDTLAGLLEVRGQGVVRVPALAFAPVDLVVDDGPAERLPEPEQETLRGVRVPRLKLALQDASAAAKLAVALSRL